MLFLAKENVVFLLADSLRLVVVVACLVPMSSTATALHRVGQCRVDAYVVETAVRRTFHTIQRVIPLNTNQVIWHKIKHFSRVEFFDQRNNRVF